MSQGEARNQRLHLCLPRDRHFFWGKPHRLYHHNCWEQAEGDVLCEGEDLPILWGGLGKGRGHKPSAPEHADVQLWVSRQTTSGGLSPCGRVTSLLSCAWEVVLPPPPP